MTTRSSSSTTKLIPVRAWTVALVRDAGNRKTLTKMHLKQLAVFATFFDSLATTPKTIPTALFNEWTRLSRVCEVGTHRYDLWMVGRDSGCLFWKDDEEPVGVEIIDGRWVAYPKQGWVKRGLELDLTHLAWELETRDGPDPGRAPEPERQRTVAVQWAPIRDRKSAEDFES